MCNSVCPWDGLPDQTPSKPYEVARACVHAVSTACLIVAGAAQPKSLFEGMCEGVCLSVSGCVCEGAGVCVCEDECVCVCVCERVYVCVRVCV